MSRYRAIITCDDARLGVIHCQIYDAGTPVWRESICCFFTNVNPIIDELDRLYDAGMLWNYCEAVKRVCNSVKDCSA